MFKYVILIAIIGLAYSAPAPAPAPKPLSVISEIKTPASTAKLAPLVAPIATPLISPISRIAFLPQLSPYAYAYPAPLTSVEIGSLPSSYSIEQHGYHITY